jgi:hypothetical protein
VIRIEIHLVSAVHPDRSRFLGSVLIANDGTGDKSRGNYTAAATRDGRRKYFGVVRGFPRRSRSALELLRRALNAIHQAEPLP